MATAAILSFVKSGISG